MVMSFCASVGASTIHTWTTLSGSGVDDVRAMTRKSIDDPGRPAGIVLSAAASFWLPVSPKRVFDFVRNENSRSDLNYVALLPSGFAILPDRSTNNHGVEVIQKLVQLADRC
ncbi:Homeobox-leucine zipper protein hdg2 [Datura stramonium]|uniref:Homeobox-leucine zipper protein hdg2 n=1 Tax=Datura stramonium TaxID=4076 RepID=A0ABS8WN40_DATST|nr:Homeobox-leucine zipper protein hdg2 [Datura stramonium]